MILLGKGRDCTELFESIHALSKVNLKAILERYKIKDSQKTEETFTWKEDQFYVTLKNRVRKHFLEGDGLKTGSKATWRLVLKIAIMWALLFYSWAKAMQTGSVIYSALSGTITFMLAFCVLHDGSHGALSKNPFWNFSGLMYATWILWNPWIWLQHHVYGHHSYTGVLSRDPDLDNSKSILRKHPTAKQLSAHKYQHLYVWPLMMLLPNQHLAQSYQYVQAKKRKRVFEMALTELDQKPLHLDPVMPSNLIGACSFIFHIGLPLYCLPLLQAIAIIVVHYTFMGINYFLCVLPNHDQHETFQNHPHGHGQQMDWGEQQVRCSGNHSTSNSWWDWSITQLWGGMNFQIEHHLFPAIGHEHLSTIAPIVRKTCRDFNIPYNGDKSWLNSIIDFHKLLKEMASTK